jgi:hypothetical protein
VKQQRYVSTLWAHAQVADLRYRQNRELAELKQRLERLQQTLREHGYLDDGGSSTKSSQAKAQAERVHTIGDLRTMERSLEQRVEAITTGSVDLGA